MLRDDLDGPSEGINSAPGQGILGTFQLVALFRSMGVLGR